MSPTIHGQRTEELVVYKILRLYAPIASRQSHVAAGCNNVSVYSMFSLILYG